WGGPRGTRTRTGTVRSSGDLLLGATHHERRELLASTLDPLGLEVQPVDHRARARERDLAERLREQTTRGVDVVVVELELEQVAQLVEGQPCGDPERAAVERLDLRLAPVVLVGELADDLLERVLDRHEPRDAPVLV